MELQERVWWREEPKALLKERGEPLEFDDYHVDALCCHGVVMLYRFVDEEHGERDATQAVEVTDEEIDEASCHYAPFVDEEHEED